MKHPYIFLAAILIALCPLTSQAKETKDIIYKLKYGQPVVFSHDIHLAKYNNNCRICHMTIFNLKGQRHFTMAEMEKGKSCGACHTGYTAFSVAKESDCTRCHTGKPFSVTYRVKGATEVVFSHENHLSMLGATACKSCHNGKVITGKERNVTMAQMEKGKTCGACHDGKTAFTVAGNCGNCHKGMTPPKVVSFKIKGVADAAFSHEIHTGMYKCSDCHTKIFQYKTGAKHYTMADMAKGKSCGACHNGKDAFASTGDCTKCHPTLKPGVEIFKTSMGEASFSHEFHLGMYKCADCHTKVFKYKRGGAPATMADMEKGKSCGTCHNGNDAFSVKDDCGKCHKM